MLEEGEGSSFPVEKGALEGEAMAVLVDGIENGCAWRGGVEGGGADCFACVHDEFGKSEKTAVAERCVVGQPLELSACLVQGVCPNAVERIRVELDRACSECIVVL